MCRVRETGALVFTGVPVQTSRTLHMACVFLGEILKQNECTYCSASNAQVGGASNARVGGVDPEKRIVLCR